MSNEYDRQIDEELFSDAGEIEDTYFKKGMDYVKYEVRHEAETEGKDKVFISVLDLKGSTITESDKKEWPGYMPSKEALSALNANKTVFYENRFSDIGQHNIRGVYKKVDNSVIIWFSTKNNEKKRLWLIIKNVFQPALLLMIIFSAAGGWFLAKRSLEGLNDVTAAALEISEKGDIEKRLEIKNRGLEIETLSLTFNRMLDRIQSLVNNLRSTTDNMAHDLRNPVTRIRGAAEILLLGEHKRSDYTDMCGNTIEECDRLLDMMNTMLDVSEAESGINSPDLKRVDLSRILLDLFDLYEPAAEAQKIQFRYNVDDDCQIMGNTKLIQRLIANLIDNSLKYTSEGEIIELDLKKDGEIVCFKIKDSGMGIKSEDIPHVFKKFFRGDKSRSTSGVGLGLSLVKIICRQHDAQIDLESTYGQGTVFTVKFKKIS
jgi:signal transduction histidine kinase